jgi:hypothetical protein
MSLVAIALTAGKYVTFGVVSISVTNLLIIALMVVVFVSALLVPFPRERRERAARPLGHDGRRAP